MVIIPVVDFNSSAQEGVSLTLDVLYVDLSDLKSGTAMLSSIAFAFCPAKE